MPFIYVHTDNNDAHDKVFNGKKAGDDAGKAEGIMQKTIKRVIDKEADFTTNKIDNPKGYTIRLKIEKIEINGDAVVVHLVGEIVRYPKSVNKKGQSGDVMVSTGMKSKGTVTGGGKRAVLDGVEAAAEALAKKSIEFMKADWKNR